MAFELSTCPTCGASIVKLDNVLNRKMRQMIKIVFVLAEDWQGIYVHNNLLVQQHSIDAMTGAYAITSYIFKNIRFQDNEFIWESYEINQEWLEDSGELPDKFDEIPANMLVKIN